MPRRSSRRRARAKRGRFSGALADTALRLRTAVWLVQRIGRVVRRELGWRRPRWRMR